MSASAPPKSRKLGLRTRFRLFIQRNSDRPSDDTLQYPPGAQNGIAEPTTPAVRSPSPPKYIITPATDDLQSSSVPRRLANLRQPDPDQSVRNAPRTGAGVADGPDGFRRHTEPPERGRTPTRSTHLDSDSHRTHNRRSSNASSNGTADSNWDDILPEQIDCTLKLHLDGEELVHPGPIISVQWTKKAAFAQIGEAANQRLEQAKSQIRPDADTDLPLPEHYLENGSCRMIGTLNGSRPLKLENNYQVREVLIKAICGFIAEFPIQRFGVEVKWHYSTFSIRPEPNTAYKATICEAIHAKEKKNFAGDPYFARSDLSKITSTLDRNRLIEEDQSIKDKDKFKQMIFPTKAVRLLAVCIYAMLDLVFLEKLLECSPFDDQNCPTPKFHHPTIKTAPYARFVEIAPRFFAHRFGEDEQADPEIYADIPENIVVPIHFDEAKDLLGFGVYSEVFKVTIHAWHHVFAEDRTQAFALKRFKEQPGQSIQRRKEKFNQEREMLRMLKAYRRSTDSKSNTTDSHVVTHLAAWTQKGSFYILFPMATCNLKTFMEYLPGRSSLPNCPVAIEMPIDSARQVPLLNEKFGIWLLEQLIGLAEGIQRVHHLALHEEGTARRPEATGFHHDLKPDNILVFVDPKQSNSYGTFKIGDFGSGRAQMLTRSGMYKETPQFTDKYNGAPTYTSPDRLIVGQMSRTSDMWSLGCIFLEILDWAFLSKGPSRRSFSKDRLEQNRSRFLPGEIMADFFWSPWTAKDGTEVSNLGTKPKAVLNPAVREKLTALKAVHPKGSSPSPFDTVTECTEKMLTIDRVYRIKASALKFALDSALLNLKNALNSHQPAQDAESQTILEAIVSGSERYFEPFPTPTTVPADGTDLPDPSQGLDDPNFLSPQRSPPRNREPSPASREAALLLAGRVTTERNQAPSLADAQQHGDQISLDPSEAATKSDRSVKARILGQSHDTSDFKALSGPSDLG